MKKVILPAIALLIASTAVNAQTTPARSKAKQTTTQTTKASATKKATTASAAKDSTKATKAVKHVAKKHTATATKKPAK